jgi:hypothetical protein
MKWTRIDKNKIYSAIQESHLDAAECALSVNGGEVTITHKSGSSFQFYLYSTRKGQVLKATADVVDGTEQEFILEIDIEEITPLIYDWANEVQQVADTPDLWVEMQRSREFIFDVQQTDSGNTLFTEDEQSRIEAQLQEIAKHLKEQFGLTKEQTERIDEWRDEVAEASTRMGRKDWLIYLLGTITALIITATVTAGVGEHILTMVIHSLGHLFTGGEPPRILGMIG